MFKEFFRTTVRVDDDGASRTDLILVKHPYDFWHICDLEEHGNLSDLLEGTDFVSDDGCDIAPGAFSTTYWVEKVIGDTMVISETTECNI